MELPDDRLEQLLVEGLTEGGADIPIGNATKPIEILSTADEAELERLLKEPDFRHTSLAMAALRKSMPEEDDSEILRLVMVYMSF